MLCQEPQCTCEGLEKGFYDNFLVSELHMISAPKGMIFRKEAIERYAQGRDKNVLPQFVMPPVFVFLWCLLALFVSAGITAWLGQVPVYASGVGIVLDPSSSGGTANGELTAVIFIPYSPSLHLQAGQPVNMQLGQTGPQISTAIGAVESEILSPSMVRKQFLVSLTEPSVAITVVVGSNLSLYSGSPIQHAQIEVGSRRLLSLFPGLSAFT
jgi:hypothetical protein